MDSLQILKDKAEKCSFCKLKEINELKYGPLYKRNGLVAHYYCVLFSFRVIQNGADDEGILGFLVRDIKIELRRVKNIRCHYCSKPNASVYCANTQCDKIFHFPCGIARKSLHQYKGSFKSYCSDHRPKQKIPLEYLTEAQQNKPKCVICYEDIDCANETEVLWANCCLKNWYHRDCLQKFALSSGYLFKCAICSNRRQFKQWVEEYGIFVPKQKQIWHRVLSKYMAKALQNLVEQKPCPKKTLSKTDASWELEPNAFSELLVQHGRCDASSCVCPYGRDYSADYHARQWEIILCKSCGSQGIHPACSHRLVTSNWECDLCKLVRKNLRAKRYRTSNRTQLNAWRGRRMRDREDFGNGATSSCSQNLSETATNSSAVARPRRERKRKILDVLNDLTQLKKTALEAGQNSGEGSQQGMEKADTSGYAHSSTSQTNFHAQEAIHHEAVDLDVSNESSDDEEIVVDGPEVSYVGTSSNDDIEESKRKDQGIVIIDLTETTPVDKEEIITVMETYRTIQLSDVRYRVKKEVYVLSDDDDDDDDKEGDKNDDGGEKSVDNELEIILHKNNSTGSQNSSIVKRENDESPSVFVEECGGCSSSDPGPSCLVGDDPQDEEMTEKTESKTLEDDDTKPKEHEAEVEVMEVPDEKIEAKLKSCVKNENPGSSSRAGEPDEELTSELLDKYFIIFLEEKRNRSRLERLSKDIKKVVLSTNKNCGVKSSMSSKTKQADEDEDSHITVSSDSETEYSGVKGRGDGDGDGGDDDDDVQIIDNASG